MKYIHYLYIVPLALLTACNSEEPTSITDNSGKEAIVLSAGIVEGGHSAVTRAGAEDNHARHLTLTTDTKLALQVSGTWTNHSPESVVKATTASIGDATGADNKHNKVSCSPVLYWDDYGTADPANAETGRTTGLTIYGAAINGKTTLPDAITAPTTSSWTIAWTLNADQTAEGNTPTDKDLLISNNVKGDNGDPYENDYGRYLFDQRSQGKLLEFTHALSKITVNLKAGAGFTNNVFANSPEVKLTSNLANQTSVTEWAYTTGTVDVTTGSVTSQAGNAVVTMNQLSTATTGYNVTKEALVMPGSQFTADNANIIRINADGNIYYVTAAKIRAKMFEINSSTDYKTEAGKNYIINVTVNKTGIDNITATVANWVDVTAAEVSPIINVDTSHGTTSGGTDFNRNEFSFYRSSTGLNTGYSTDPSSLLVGSYYAEETYLSRSSSSDPWSMNTQLYWPNHQIHYQFRGVWPRTVTTDGEGVLNSPRVEMSNSLQVIKVKNVAYAANTFPSDLQIGRPDVATDATCSNTETGHHTTKLYDGETVDNVYWGGICATEGKINLAFKYMMSQVEVNLSTTSGTDAVTLTNAKVEIVNVYNTADVTLGSREVIPTGSTGSYTLNTVSGDGNENKRLSAIVPQTLTYSSAQASTNVRFKITITNGDSTTDVYYADVNPILESGKSTKVAPNGKWESGVHYVYNLKLSKTKVNVTATLAEWTTVTAGSDVWF